MSIYIQLIHNAQFFVYSSYIICLYFRYSIFNLYMLYLLQQNKRRSHLPRTNRHQSIKRGTAKAVKVKRYEVKRSTERNN